MNISNIDFRNLRELPLPLQVMLIAIACTLLSAAGYYFHISSLKKTLVVTQKDETDLKVQVKSLYTNQASMYEAIAKRPMIEKTLSDWQGKLIKSSDLPDLLNDILKTGTGNQLQFKLFNPAPAIAEGPYLKVPIKTEIIGTYHQIAAFFSDLANMQSIVVISNFTLLNSSADDRINDTKISVGKNNDTYLQASITLEVYYLPEKPA